MHWCIYSCPTVFVYILLHSILKMMVFKSHITDLLTPKMFQYLCKSIILSSEHMIRSKQVAITICSVQCTNATTKQMATSKGVIIYLDICPGIKNGAYLSLYDWNYDGYIYMIKATCKWYSPITKLQLMYLSKIMRTVCIWKIAKCEMHILMWHFIFFNC